MEYSDTIIMALRKKYESKQLETLKSSKDTLRKEIQIGTAAIPLYKEQLFHNLCSIMLPETMDDMDYLDRFVKYQNQNRPEVIRQTQREKHLLHLVYYHKKIMKIQKIYPNG